MESKPTDLNNSAAKQSTLRRKPAEGKLPFGHDLNKPISSEMIRKVQALQSSYPDTFDWTVYDRLYNKFGANQPRGGTVFKTTFRLANHHSSCSKCHYAFEIDTYGRGCTHNCTYCYAL